MPGTTRSDENNATVLRVQLAKAQQELESLRKQRAVLDNLINNLPYFFFWKDRNFKFRGCNKLVADAFGFDDPSDIIGLDDEDLNFTPEEIAAYREVDREVMEENRPRLNVEEPQTQPNGEVHTLLTSKMPLLENGEVVGMVGLFTDITHRKRMEEDLRQAKSAAEASEQAKSDFLATMSHELRTPLTLIAGPLEHLLRTAELPVQVRSSLQTVKRNTARLQLLVDNVLDYTKAQAGHLKPRWESVELTALIASSVADAQSAARARNLKLTATVPEYQLERVQDRWMLERIVFNLLSNALKFTPPGGRVEVRLREDLERPGGVTIEVQDTGLGIAEADQSRLFEKFQQIDSSSTRNQSGTGLGLSLVRECVRALGGQVSVESALGQGSCFTVRLPQRTETTIQQPESTGDGVAPEASSPARELEVLERGEDTAWTISEHDDALVSNAATDTATAGTTDLATTDLVHGRILVAEDHADMCAFIASLLRADGFEVDTARNGQDAWQQILDSPPDLVVSDVMMPLVDGFELLRRIKTHDHHRHIPVILLTARAGPGAEITGLSAGADDYVRKPFAPAELQARVASVMRAIHLRRELVRAERLAALGRVMAQFAHEINNPANVISNNLPFLRRSVDSLGSILDAYRAAEPTLPETLQAELQALRTNIDLDFLQEDLPLVSSDIAHAIDRIVFIQRNLSAFLRTESPPLESTTPTQLLNRALAIVGVSLKITANGLDSVPAVQCAPEHAVQILVNLLRNARSSNSEAVDISASVNSEGTHLALLVRDWGTGVPEGLAEQIFEPFFTTRAVGQGIGLGLAVSRELAQRGGGRLTLDETIADGARFVLELPLARPGH